MLYDYIIREGTIKDLSAVKTLQNANHYKNLTEKEMQKEGFVSVETDISVLEKILDNLGIIIAESKGKIIGYMIPMAFETAKDIPLLVPFVEKISKLEYQDKKIYDYNAIIAGQICVAKENKGVGIANKLNDMFLKMLKNKGYEMVITEVSSKNPRSLHVATTKLKYEIINQYEVDDMNWYVLVKDLRGESNV
jgi:predicted GNAT superfamily acetyltransferase